MAGAPWWFLDVDGVLNAFPPPAAGRAPDGAGWTYRATRVATEVGGFTVTVADELLARLHDVHRTGRAAVVWCTTWGEDAAASLAPALGLPHWPVAPYPDDLRCAPLPGWSSAPWWKVEAISRWLDREPRPYVVTDDDLTPDAADELRARHPDLPALWLRPSTCPGLTPEQADEVEAFLSAHPGDPAGA
jgi:hypothetical protein